MIKYFQKKYAMTRPGAKDFVKAIVWTTIERICFMLPVMLAFGFLQENINVLTGESTSMKQSIWLYVGLGACFFVLIFMISLKQYDSNYTCIYKESAKKRIALAEKLRVLPLAFFERKDIADLSSTVMKDATELETIFSHTVPQLYAVIISASLISIGLLAYNYKMALILLWIVPVALLIFYFTRNAQNKIWKQSYSLSKEIQNAVQEGLDSISEIKAYNFEDKYNQKVWLLIEKYEKFSLKSELVVASLLNVSKTLLQLGTVSVAIGGAVLFSQNKINIITLIAFLVVSGSIYYQFMQVLENFASLLFLKIRIDRQKEMEALPIQKGKTKFRPKKYSIEFKDVSFSYEKDMETLSNISFVAKQGEVTALVGPSGGGKSTVAKLAARFWDIQSGQITLGGEDISQVDAETLLQSYSIVFQNVILFDNSVLENIRVGKKDASDEEVIKAAKLAQCDEFVGQLPEGYDTNIGENGARLSGGERQRISIARALLKDAPIILLDEATASLDVENETKIQQALSALIKNKTVIIIAHRMRTVRNADKIVVIKEGEIVEQGKPDILLKDTKSYFYKMNEER